MKQLHGAATGTTGASAEDCLRFLAAVEDYPRWHEDVVRAVTVLERDDQHRPSQVRAKLHVTRGPFARDLELTLAVAVGPDTVKLTRIPHEPGDEEMFAVLWRVQGAAPTRILLDIEARLDVPRLIPTGGVGEEMASNFVAAACRALSSARG